MKCDHIIGYSAGIEGGWLTKWSKSGQDLDDLETRFKFCPECGENIENLKLKRRYNHPKWNSSMTPQLQKLGDDIAVKMMKKAISGNPLLKVLMDATVNTIVQERK